ncbi:MAG: DUF2079 domain-containing protein [bacterium]|nr:DUF2079 domain-containing protein [bacterium]
MEELTEKRMKLFWAAWLAIALIIIAVSSPLVFNSFWVSLLGLFFFSVLLTPPLGFFIETIALKKEGWLEKRGLLLIFIIWLLFVAFYSVFALHRQENYFTGYDLAIYDQAVWHLSRFEIPESSLRNVPVVFGDHFAPALSLLVPFYWLFPTPSALLVLQVIITLLPVWFFWLWGRDWKIKPSYILIISLFYLTSPAIQGFLGFDFHDILFGPLFLSAAFYFLQKKNWLFYFFNICLLIFTREVLPLLVAVIGVFVFFRERLRQIGIITLLIGIIAFPIIVGPLMNSYNYSFVQRSPYFQMFPGFDQGLKNGVINMIKNPGLILRVISEFPDKWWTISFFILPLAPALFFEPWLLVLFLPQLAEKILSSYQYLSFMKFQYNLLFAPLAAIAFIYLIKKLAENDIGGTPREKTNRLKLFFPRPIMLFLVFPLVLNLVYSSQYSYLLSPFQEWKFTSRESPSAPTEAFQELVDIIPKDVQAKVAASQVFLPHLNHRQNLYLLPRISDASFIIFNFCPKQPCNYWPIQTKNIIQLNNFLRNNPSFEVEKVNEAGVVFERKGPFTEKLRQDLAAFCLSLISDQEHLHSSHKQYLLENCSF